MSALLRVAALVLFIVAAVVAWVTDRSVADALGFVAAGLACWAASTIAPPAEAS